MNMDAAVVSHLKFLPIAEKILRESSVGNQLLGTDYAEYIKGEIESLAYALAATVNERLRELEGQ